MTLSGEIATVVLGLVLACGGGVVWMVRLEGRVNLMQRVLETHLDDAKLQYHQLILRLDSLATKLDKLMLNCVAHQHLKPEAYGVGAVLHRRRDDSEGNGL